MGGLPRRRLVPRGVDGAGILTCWASSGLQRVHVGSPRDGFPRAGKASLRPGEGEPGRPQHHAVLFYAFGISTPALASD